MISLNQIIVGSDFEFNTYGIQAGINHYVGTIVGLTHSSQLPADSSAIINHENVYKHLPAEVKEVVPNDYSSYMYLAIALENTEVIKYVGLPWIKSGTFREIISEKTTVVLTDLTSEQKLTLRSLLELYNYKVLKIETK